jgi:hypothetical protein
MMNLKRLFTCSSFKDVVNSSNYIASNDTMINVQLIRKGTEGMAVT